MIVLLDLLVLGFIAVMILLFVTQIAIPMKNGTPLFPLFAKTSTAEAVKHAHEELEHVAELEQLDELQDEINRRKAQLKKEDTNE